MRPGYVYIITNEAWPGYVKFGAATSLKGRHGDAQTWSPHRDFKLHTAHHFPDRFTAEGQIKKRLCGCRKKGGEWFRIHYDDAATLLNQLHKEMKCQSKISKPGKPASATSTASRSRSTKPKTRAK